ncbi:LPS assembly lipoprotein LptE [Limnohabitans sp.]|uniref:LPS-assembly lipoprotein LptE n=1 Tax=Limnohabitans sp. TaxID=1907725 RepID=UPI0038EE258B
MKRRLLCAVVAAAALGACGFRLRGSGDFAFRTLYANVSTRSALGNELKRHLLGTGRIDLVADAQQQMQADVVLDILSESRERVVVGLNASGQVRELQLRLKLRFRLRSPAGQEWIEPVELQQQRDLSFTETAALSKEIEEDMMFRDMQTDLVQQIMRRLAAARPPAGR